jgi:hypothetical protein
LNVAISENYLTPIAEWLGGPRAHARARVLAATIIGFLVERSIRGQALSGADRDVYIQEVTAILARLIEPPPGPSARPDH